MIFYNFYSYLYILRKTQMLEQKQFKNSFIMLEDKPQFEFAA